MGQSHKTSQGERMVGLILLLTWVVITSGQRNERPTFVDPVLYTKTIYASLSAKCPAGIIKCECLNAVGTFTEGPFDPDEDPLQALITYVGCGPGYCFCKDNPQKEVDVRPQLSSTVLDLCPRNELNRCLCQDSETRMEPPFGLLKVNNCRPRKCKCNGSNKGMAARKGAIPTVLMGSMISSARMAHD